MPEVEKNFSRDYDMPNAEKCSPFPPSFNLDLLSLEQNKETRLYSNEEVSNISQEMEGKFHNENLHDDDSDLVVVENGMIPDEKNAKETTIWRPF